MFITKDTKRHLLCCCHDNSSATGLVLIKTTIPSFCLNQGPCTPVNLMVRGKTICHGYHARYRQEPLSYFRGLNMRTSGFWQKETGAMRVSMTTTLWLCFSFSVLFFLTSWSSSVLLPSSHSILMVLEYYFNLVLYRLCSLWQQTPCFQTHVICG